VKDMPCSTNRFSVLEECNDSKPEYMPSSHTPKHTPVMSKPLPNPEQVLVRTAAPRRSTELQIQLESIDSHHPMAVTALLDSGASGLFIDVDYVFAKNLTTNRLPRAVPVYNIDGTLNEHGSVKETVDLIVRYQDHTERATFFVTALGGVPVILGHPWLARHNPHINWRNGKVTMSGCPSECRIRHIQLQRKTSPLTMLKA